MSSKGVAPHTFDFLLAGFVLTAGVFIVALRSGWGVLEMVSGLLLLLLVAALSFRMIFWSMWPFGWRMRRRHRSK